MANIVKIRIVLWLLLASFVLFFAIQKIIPSGKARYSFDFQKSSFFISKLAPAERLAYGDKEFQNNVIAGPVYFNVRTPRVFDTAKVRYTYQNAAETPLIETGVLADKTIWRYDLKPVENRLLDQLSGKWRKITENDLLLLIRPEVEVSGAAYGTIADFVKNPPDISQIAVFNCTLDTDYVIRDYRPESSEIILPSLRGAYQLFAYLKDEDMDFSFEFFDLNSNKDKDEVEIRVYFGNEIIYSDFLPDDGITEDKGEASASLEKNINLSGMPEGVYKIEIKTNNDVVTKKITTRQTRVSLINKFELYKTGKSDIAIYSDSRNFQFTTTHPDSLQTARIGNNFLDIMETYKQFTASAEASTTKILLEHDGLIVSGEGVFAFSPDSLVNPMLKKADNNLDIDDSGVNYILAKYNNPNESDDWKTAEATFDLRRAYREDDRYSFLISVPDKDFASSDSGLVFKEIKIELTGKSLWSKFGEVLKRNK